MTPERTTHTMPADQRAGVVQSVSSTCPDTGRLHPECGCAACGRRLVERFAPHLLQA